MRRLLGWALLLGSMGITDARAAVTDYLERPILAVHLRSNGVEVRDPSVVDVIETRAGQPLRMADVRETMAHLFGLGRYSDIEVDAGDSGSGVVLTYSVTPVQRVRRVEFRGDPELPRDELRRAVVDRYGASPPLARAPQIVGTLTTLYRNHGYPAAEILVRPEPDRSPDDTILAFEVRPGVHARVGTIEVQGTPAGSTAALLDALDLRRGGVYDGVALDARLARYADDLRSRGYYLARATHLPRFADDGRTVEHRPERRPRAARRDRLRGRSAGPARARAARAHRPGALGGRRPARRCQVRD